jgi:hypothetical protein
MAERIALAAIDAPHQEISKFGVPRRDAKLPRDLLDTWGTSPKAVAVGVEEIDLIPIASGNSALDRNVGECALQSDNERGPSIEGLAFVQMSEPMLQVVAGNARERLGTIEKIAYTNDELLVGERALKELEQVVPLAGDGM